MFTLVPRVVGGARHRGRTLRDGGSLRRAWPGRSQPGSRSRRWAPSAMLVDAATFMVIAVAALLLRARRAVPGSPASRKARLAGFTFVGATASCASRDRRGDRLRGHGQRGGGVLRDGHVGVDAWGYGVLATAWLVGMVGGATPRPPSPRRPAALVGAGRGGERRSRSSLRPPRRTSRSQSPSSSWAALRTVWRPSRCGA